MSIPSRLPPKRQKKEFNPIPGACAMGRFEKKAINKVAITLESAVAVKRAALSIPVAPNILGVHHQDIRHGKERDETGDQFRTDRRLVLLEFKYFLQHNLSTLFRLICRFPDFNFIKSSTCQLSWE